MKQKLQLRTSKFLVLIFISIFSFVIFQKKRNTLEGFKFFKDLSVPSFNNSSSCLSILGEGKFSPFKDWKCDIENQEQKNDKCFKEWIPDKCSLYIYSLKNATKCFSLIPDKKYIYFLGDSRIRYIYNKIVFFLDKKVLPPKFTHDDTSINKERGTVISFFSHRVMNEAFLKNVRKIKRNLNNNSTYIVVIGITLHMMIAFQNKQDEALKEFRYYLSKAREDLDYIAKKATVLWFLQAPRSISKRIVQREVTKRFPNLFDDKPSKSLFDTTAKFQKVKDFFFKKFDYIVKLSDNIKQLPQYNSMAENILNGTGVKIWYSAKYIGEKSLEDYIDPTHFSDYANYNLMQILLNMLCNKHLKFDEKFCCS